MTFARYERETLVATLADDQRSIDRFTQQNEQVQQSYLGAKLFNKLKNNHLFSFNRTE